MSESLSTLVTAANSISDAIQEKGLRYQGLVKVGDQIRSLMGETDLQQFFTKEEKEEIAKGAYQAMTENAEYIEHTKNYNRFLLRVIHRESVDSVKQYCDMVDKGLITDLAGNTYSCVIRLSKIGTLETFESCPSYGNIHWSNRKKCKDCLLLQLCGGHCVRQKDGWEFEKSCENSYYPFHLGLFKAAFKQLFNVDIIEIENA